MVKVKICCISSATEALMAIQAGATELGLVGQMPSGPGIISTEEMKSIIKVIPKEINTFLLTSENSAQKIIDQHKLINTNTIQIVDKLVDGNYSDIRTSIPGIRLVHVIHVIDEKSIAEAVTIENNVDYILLDSGNPNKTVKELGGTGRVHNWEISKKIVNSVKCPVFLAGGLNSANVRQAIETVGPHGVDLCSGVRSNNALDEALLSSFFSELKA